MLDPDDELPEPDPLELEPPLDDDPPELDPPLDPELPPDAPPDPVPPSVLESSSDGSPPDPELESSSGASPTIILSSSISEFLFINFFTSSVAAYILVLSGIYAKASESIYFTVEGRAILFKASQ